MTFLGPSVPADDLARYVAAQRPDVVGLSCSMAVSLKGAAHSIQACRRAGVPVLAGGAGFGPAGRYAARLGAAAWAPDAVTAVELLEQGLDARTAPAPLLGTGDEEHQALERDKEDFVSTALAGFEGDDARLREALTFLLSTLESALYVMDHGVLLGACRPAAERLLAAAHPSAASTSSSVATLFGLVRQRLPKTWALLEESRLVEIAPARTRNLERT